MKRVKRNEGLIYRIMKGLKKITKSKTFKNKMYAVGLEIIGVLSILPEHDITAFIFIQMFALPLFFAKDNWITD